MKMRQNNYGRDTYRLLVLALPVTATGMREHQCNDPMDGGASMRNYILNRLGYHPMSRREAMDLAERLLSNGWED